MKKEKKTLSREISLEIASICGKHFFGIEHLHYGYWTKGLEPKILNMHAAQVNYVKFLHENIPDGVKTILDVGCGAGHVAKYLTDKGYEVDCVSPSHYLAEKARALLGDKCKMYECFYEELETDKKYDMVMFSESFQYMKPEESLPKSVSVLNPDGHILICDVFKKNNTDGLGRNPLPGGFLINRVYDALDSQPLELKKDIDISENAATNLDLENEVYMQVGKPVLELVEKLMADRHPLITKLANWKFRKKKAKLEKKYFSGTRSGENFKKFKTYRLMLYKLTA